MTGLAIVVPVLVAAVVALATPWLLRRLPAPAEEPGLVFAALATRRFRLCVLAVASAAGAIALLTTAPALWPAWTPLAGLGALLGMVDLHTGFLPLRLNYLTLALVALGAGLSCWLRADATPALVALAGGLGATGLYWVLWRLSRGQLGFGDVRLAGVLGIAGGATSPSVLVWTFLLGSLIGAGWALAVKLSGRGPEFAYGPSMLLGAPAALVLAALLPSV